MQKTFINAGIAICILLFLNCRGPANNNETSSGQQISSDSAFTDGHTSANSLDVEGTYKGVLPCSDCEGIETVIILNKQMTFVKRTQYLGKNGKVFEEKGNYTWNNAGNTIELNGINDSPSLYFVGENYLMQLDMEGNKIAGNLSDKYVLTKGL